MKVSFIIRAMKKDDIYQIQDVAKKSWNATYDEIIPLSIQENFLNVAYNDEMIIKRMEESFIFVSEIEYKVVGFANFTRLNDELQSELSAIYLYPKFQGRGIGTALLEKGIKELDNVVEIYIDVEDENIIGKTFYEAKGFKIIKKFDDNFDSHILKTVRMCLTL